jgi:hypothetical protein
VSSSTQAQLETIAGEDQGTKRDVSTVEERHYQLRKGQEDLEMTSGSKETTKKL